MTRFPSLFLFWTVILFGGIALAQTRAAIDLDPVSMDDKAVNVCRQALRGAEGEDRDAAVISLLNARKSNLLSDETWQSLFEDAIAGLGRTGGYGYAPRLALAIDRDRAARTFLDRGFLSPHAKQLGPVLDALNEAHATLPAKVLTDILDGIDPTLPKADRSAFGEALKMLAIVGDPSAAQRIEDAMALRLPDDFEPKRFDSFFAGDAAQAFLILNGIADADQIVFETPRGVAEKPTALDDVFWAMNVDGEVNNGGFSQYFSNRTGTEAAHAADALDRIGAKGAAEMVRAAVAALGPDATSPDDQRRDRAITPNAQAVLDKLDERWYRDDDGLNVLLARYIVAHRDQFIEARNQRKQ